MTRLYKYAKPERKMLYISSLLAVLGGCIAPISTLMMTEVLDIFLNDKNDSFMSDIRKWSLLFIVLAVAAFIFYTL